jgi:hypothetical protein
MQAKPVNQKRAGNGVLGSRHVSSEQEKEKKNRAVFESFLKAWPSFAASLASWQVDLEDTFVDVNCRLISGDEIAFQLGEWLDGAQMSASLSRKRLEEQILGQLRDLNVPKNIHCVWLVPKDDTPRLNPRTATRLKAELSELIHKIDGIWNQNPVWHSLQGYPCRGLRRYPTLEKYLREVHFNPIPRQSELGFGDWIQFEPDGGAYSPEKALRSLEAILDKKLGHYGHVPQPFQLLIHYATGYLHNTPYHSIEMRTFADVAKHAARVVETRTHNVKLPFADVYLLEDVGPHPQAFRLFPRFEQVTESSSTECDDD